MNQRGFTVIELLFLTVLLAVVGVVFWTQKNNIEIANRDDKRKVSINALYYGLEKVFYPTQGYYPKQLSTGTLPSIDPAHFKDPNGVAVGTPNSDFRYEPKKCEADKCMSYSLRTKLQSEADFVKTSDHK